MISFRYHVVSLVAVLLALAVGIAVGSGPLQRTTAEAEGGEQRALRLAREQATQAEEELAFSDAYADATARRVLAGRLDGRAVTLVGLPGSDEDTVATVTDLVGRSGGSVTARLTVAEELLEVDNRQLVAELAVQMHREAADEVAVPQQADGYERMARLLAHTVATTRPGGEPVDDVGDSVLAGLGTAELAAPEATIERRGSLVVLVTGAPFGDADTQEGAGSILTTFVTALDEGSDGVVVAGPHDQGSTREATPDGDGASDGADDVAGGGAGEGAGEGGTTGGLVAAVRDDATASAAVSTVDIVDRTAGAVATVLAAAAEASGTTGHYGTADSPDGPVPGAAPAD